MRAIVFDFDGTILESVDTKTRAFETLFAGVPEHVESIVALHLAHGGVSRFEKFRMIYESLLKREPQPGEFDDLGRRFQALVYEAVVACPFVTGASEFLEDYSPKYPLAVVSGTPHQELLDILARRRIHSRFVESCGSPPGKPQILSDLLRRHQWAARDVLMVGDAMSDYEAAVAVGAQFVGRVTDSNPFPAGTQVVSNMIELRNAVPLD